MLSFSRLQPLFSLSPSSSLLYVGYQLPQTLKQDVAALWALHTSILQDLWPQLCGSSTQVPPSVFCPLSTFCLIAFSLLAVSGLNAASLLAFFSPVSLHSTYSKSHCHSPFQTPSWSLPPPHLCLTFIRHHSSLHLHLCHQRLESAGPTLIPVTAGMSFCCDGPSDTNHLNELNSFHSNGLSFLN